MGLFCTVSEINGNFRRKPTPCFYRSGQGFHLEILQHGWAQKTRVMPLSVGSKSLTIDAFIKINSSNLVYIAGTLFLTLLTSVPSQGLGVRLNKSMLHNFSEFNFVCSMLYV